jgi:hypothetical protein
MESKQGAVDWLIKLYQQTGKIDIFDLEVAKEMEKQQITYAYNNGVDDAYADEYKEMDDYYNQTYNK